MPKLTAPDTAPIAPALPIPYQNGMPCIILAMPFLKYLLLHNNNCFYYKIPARVCIEQRIIKSVTISVIVLGIIWVLYIVIRRQESAQYRIINGRSYVLILQIADVRDLYNYGLAEPCFPLSDYPRHHKTFSLLQSHLFLVMANILLKWSLCKK